MAINLGEEKVSSVLRVEGGTGGTTNYVDLDNKPSINGVELVGDKTSADLGLETQQIDAYTKDETNAAIASAITGKADINYVDNQLNLKADKVNTYTKTEVDNAINSASTNLNNKLNNKADKTSVYTKEELPNVIATNTVNKADTSYVNGQLALKADKENTYTKEEVDQIFDNPTITGDTLPIGSLVLYNGLTIPQNWLLCDGREVSRETYSELFAAIGTIWGSGDGTTSFNLPNYLDKFPLGAGGNTDLAETGGEKEVTLTVDTMPNHKHNIIRADGGVATGMISTSGINKGSTQTITATGGGKAHNNMSPYVGSYYIIKAKQSAGVIATVVDTLDSTSTTDALSANMGRKLGIKNNILTAKLSSETFSITDTKQIPLVVSQSVGSEISLAGNVINISNKIKKVKVSATINCQMPSVGNVYGQLTIKSSGGTVFAVSANTSNVNQYNFFEMNITPKIIDVSTVKTIRLYAYLSRQGTAHNDEYGNCYITVEAIE